MRRAHDAVKAARGDVQSGNRLVVEVDLAKFFDGVSHDILMGSIKSRIDAAAVWRQIRAYLNARIMAGSGDRAGDGVAQKTVRRGPACRVVWRGCLR